MYIAAQIAVTKKPIGQSVCTDRAMAAHTAPTDSTTEAAIDRPGLRVKHRAVAAGPTSRANISRAPTIGTLIVVAHARTSAKAIEVYRVSTP